MRSGGAGTTCTRTLPVFDLNILTEAEAQKRDSKRTQKRLLVLEKCPGES